MGEFPCNEIQPSLILLREINQLYRFVLYVQFCYSKSNIVSTFLEHSHKKKDHINIRFCPKLLSQFNQDEAVFTLQYGSEAYNFMPKYETYQSWNDSFYAKATN